MKFLSFLLWLNCVFSLTAFAGSEAKRNLRTEPIPWVLGGYSLFMDFKTSKHLTLGPMVRYSYTTYDGKNSVIEGGIQGMYYFKPAFQEDSIYLAGRLIGENSSIDKDMFGTNYKGAQFATRITVGAGYHWFWNSFNLNLGVIYNIISPSTVTLRDANGHIAPYAMVIGGAGVRADILIGFTF